MILVEVFEEEQRQKTLDKEKLAVAKTESTVLLNSCTEKSKKSRKMKAADGSFSTTDTIDLSSPSPTQAARPRHDNTMHALITSINAFGSSPVKKLKIAPETKLEEKIMEHINGQDMEATLNEAKLTLYDFSFSDSEFNLSELDVLVNIYCSPNRNFDSAYVKSEFQDLGFSKLAAAKLYKYFNDIMINFVK
jgi:hypothetical protein